MKYPLLTLAFSLGLTGCVVAPVSLNDTKPLYTEAEMRQAQEALQPQRLELKRKIAVGRLSNETTYGKSLLSDSPNDKVADKVSDMFIQGLVNSGNYLIFERPDIELLKAESELSNTAMNVIGVDTLVVGSLTEFGRATTGESGFITSSKKQEVTATIDLRLVDTKTGLVIHSITGTGAASTETSNTMGFGSVAGYDGSINDQAIGAAVNAAIAKLDSWMGSKPFTADVIAIEDGLIFISGGQSQGIEAGMSFEVQTKGSQVKSATTGGLITLPGKPVAVIRVLSTFGESELEEGSVTELISGSLDGLAIDNLQVKEIK